MSFIPLRKVVPERFLAKCAFGDHEVDTRADGVFQAIRGFTPNRSGGGAHSIALAQRENIFACPQCIERQSKGTAKQTDLFTVQPFPKPPKA